MLIYFATKAKDLEIKIFQGLCVILILKKSVVMGACPLTISYESFHILNSSLWCY